MGISLLDCISDDLEKLNQNIYDKILRLAHDLVPTGEAIEREYGIPIVNKRISVTPIALVGGNACKKPEDFVTIAKTLDKAAHEVGVNFIGGYSALVSKGMTKNDENLIRSIPEALATTERVCSSVNVGSTKTRHQHGCCPPDGRDRKRDRRAHERPGFPGLCKTRRFLQRSG